MDNKANDIWQVLLQQISSRPDYIVKPRGMEVKEIVGCSYKTPMPAYLDLVDRKINLPFMLGEAAWIVGGSNRLSGITPFMEYYKNFSDDGIFLKGAYGPKIVDQLPYITESLLKDNDTRQAYLNIWRERPAGSKDVPCTVGMQFFIRQKQLHLIVTMRSNDVVLGLTYDIFTFSMVAKAVQLLLKEQGLQVSLGNLQVNPGSLHLYDKHYEDVKVWKNSQEQDLSIGRWVNEIEKFETYDELIKGLHDLAHDAKFYRGRYDES